VSDTVNPLFQRLALITGAEVLEKLAKTNVLVFGVGGVGSWCAEALVRSGVGKIGIVDSDTVCVTNVNRQVQATSRSIGQVKVEVLKQRLLEINPRCEVNAWQKIFSRESAGEFGIETAGYVIDAIDSLTHKLDLIEISCAAGVKLFSSMGMAQNSIQPASKQPAFGRQRAALWPGWYGKAYASGALAAILPPCTAMNGLSAAKKSPLAADQKIACATTAMGTYNGVTAKK